MASESDSDQLRQAHDAMKTATGPGDAQLSVRVTPEFRAAAVIASQALDISLRQFVELALAEATERRANPLQSLSSELSDETRAVLAEALNSGAYEAAAPTTA